VTSDQPVSRPTALSDELRILTRRHPRETWASHARLGGIARFWLERHEMFCTTLHVAPGNPNAILLSTDATCVSAFAGDILNRQGDPQYCTALPFHLQSCSPDVGTACLVSEPGRLDKGAALSEAHCACGITALESISWGRIKARYR
jgi:hypothetical protein